MSIFVYDYIYEQVVLVCVDFQPLLNPSKFTNLISATCCLEMLFLIFNFVYFVYIGARVLGDFFWYESLITNGHGPDIGIGEAN